MAEMPGKFKNLLLKMIDDLKEDYKQTDE
jgi:hypothetical protein